MDVLVSAAFCCGLHWDQFQRPDSNWTKGGSPLFWLEPALGEQHCTEHQIIKHVSLCQVCDQGPVVWTQSSEMWTENDIIWEDKEEADWHFTDSKWRTCWFVFYYIQALLTVCWPLSFDSLTLEPQLAVLIRLHCLKCTFSVSTVSPILTNCTVVVAAHLHPGYIHST